MNALVQSLVSLGLTETEATLYSVGSRAMSSSVQELVRATKLKRPTMYHALRTLGEKGLVTEKRTRGVLRFSMSPSQHLHALIAEQKRKADERAATLTTLLPLLDKERLARTDGVDVVQYDGIEGMKMVMDVAFRCTSKHWDIIAPYNNFLREYDATFAQQYLHARTFHNITSRTLWEDGMRNSRKLTEEEKKNRQPRLMPWVMHGRFKSMIILFDSSIAVFSSLDKQSAMLITSPDMHALFQAMFDCIWEFSEAY